MPDRAAIEVSELRKIYRDGLFWRRSFEALKGVSFQVGKGEVFGLLGPNGAGKTTLINVLLGIVRSNGGAARLLGRPAGDRRSRLRVGYLPEDVRIPGHLNALSALDYYGGLSGATRAEIKERRGGLLEQVGLADRPRLSVRKYSKGMLQRLGLAQSLLHDPDLLLLDEPTDGLDPVGRSQVRSLLRELQSQGKTVFLNSHLLQEVELICDRVAILDQGVLRGLGSVSEIAPQKREGVELVLDVVAAEDAVRRVLGKRTPTNSERIGADQTRLSLRLPDQAAVDQLVDDLRQQKISIVGMTRRRVTLEDAFLGILAKTAESP